MCVCLVHGHRQMMILTSFSLDLLMKQSEGIVCLNVNLAMNFDTVLIIIRNILD